MGGAGSIDWLGHGLAALSRQLGAPKASAAFPSLPGEQPLPNTPVAVFELGDFTAGQGSVEPIQLGHTDDDGAFGFTDIPSGRDLVIVTLTRPRMTTIVPAPGNRTSTAVNSATSLGTEALMHFLRNQGGHVDPDRWGRGIAAIEGFFDDLDLDGEALLAALQDLIPDDFAAGLPETPRAGRLCCNVSPALGALFHCFHKIRRCRRGPPLSMTFPVYRWYYDR